MEEIINQVLNLRNRKLQIKIITGFFNLSAKWRYYNKGHKEGDINAITENTGWNNERD
jgi:hypothetical protein